MKRINLLLTLQSLTAVLFIIERLSFTTKITLQPYSFIRFHEFFQIIVITLISVIIPFLLLREITHNFETLKTRKGLLLGVLFITGIYFYTTGNGQHEIASYLFNTFCDTKHFTSTICGSMFFNDYYFGNILYFFGAMLNALALIILEVTKPSQKFSRNDIIILVINSLVAALAFFAYAAFDLVLVGLIYSIVMAIIVTTILFTSRRKFSTLPFTLYTGISYTLAAIGALIVRLY